MMIATRSLVKIALVAIMLLGACFWACSSDASHADAELDDGSDTGADDGVCREGVADCCGNGVCEEGEEDCVCPRDCDDCYQHLWQLDIDERIKMLAFDSDGHLIGRTAEEVFRVSPDGQIEWRKPVGWVSSNSPPVLSPDGATILATSTDNVIYWLDLQGGILRQQQFVDPFSYPGNGWVEPATDGSIVVLTPMGRKEPNENNERWAYYLMAYDLQTGELLWRKEWPEEAYSYRSNPSFDSQGNIYVVGDRPEGDFKRWYYLFKYSPTGDLLWTTLGDIPGYCAEPADCSVGAPVIGQDDMIIYTNGNKELLAYSSSGQELWRVQLEGYSWWAEPLVGPGGIIYMVDNSGEMLAIRPDGTIIWRTVIGILITVNGEEIMNPAITTPILTRDGYLIVPMYLDTIRVVRASDGQIMYDIADDEIWAYTFYSPLMNDSGVLYFTLGDWIFAVQTRHTGMAEGYWVRGHGNARSNSCVSPVNNSKK